MEEVEVDKIPEVDMEEVEVDMKVVEELNIRPVSKVSTNVVVEVEEAAAVEALIINLVKAETYEEEVED